MSHASELSMVRSHERYMYAHILQCDLAFRFLVPYSLSFRLFFSADFESSSTVKEKKKKALEPRSSYQTILVQNTKITLRIDRPWKMYIDYSVNF